jgi:hypothetical protein
MCNIVFLPVYVTRHKRTSSGRCPNAFLCIVHWCSPLCSTRFHAKDSVYTPVSMQKFCDSFTSAVPHFGDRGSWQLIPYWHDMTRHNVATMLLVTAGHVCSQTWSWLTTCWNCCI